MRKGIGALDIFDEDVVEFSNLNRQRFFKDDVYKNKAIALAKNLAREATSVTRITGHAKNIQGAVASNPIDATVIVCAVDNNAARAFTARYYLGKRPVVFLGVDEHAETGYVFVQGHSGACLACQFPHIVDEGGGACPKVGAVKDILKVVSGYALYAIDSLLMDRPRKWNLAWPRLPGQDPQVQPVTSFVPERETCVLHASMIADITNSGPWSDRWGMVV